MEELNKKDILTLIGENLTTIRHAGYAGPNESEDLDEMPRDVTKIKRDSDPRRLNRRAKDPEDKKFPPDWTPLYATDESGKPIEHVGFFKYNRETDEVLPIIFSCEWDELKERHPDLTTKIRNKYGDVKLTEAACGYDPPRTQEGKSLSVKAIPGEGGEEVFTLDVDPFQIGFDDEGNFKTTKTTEKINRTFNSILKKEIQEDEELNNGLKKLSLPKIIIDDPKHRNRYSTTSDSEISFQSHNINLYETQKNFIKDVAMSARLRDLSKVPEKESKPLRRLYNTKYTNWSKTRFTSNSSYGKTPVFELDQGDFPNDRKFEVMVASDVKITGKSTEKNEEGETTKWSWNITYLVEYAKKAPTDNIARKMIRDGEIDKTVEVELSEPKKFDGGSETDTGTNHPLTDINISAGLEQVIKDFKDELLSTNPADSIRRAVTKIEDLGGERNLRNAQMNESEIKKLVVKTIKENK